MTAVTICDVGPRDGLQNEPALLEPTVRAALVERLAGAGVPRVEAVSFVSPTHVPQMAGAEEVLSTLGGSPVECSTVIAGLVLNERGYERLRDAGLREAHLALGVTDAFNGRNAGATVEEGAAACERILARAADDGVRATLTLSVAFGCPFEGRVDPGRVAELGARLVAAGADEVVVADTIGVGLPRQARDLVARLLPLGRPVGAHLHNTRNTGYANALAALDAGATVLDASIGGLGGCPFAPRATGNVATEDLVHLLHGEGVETGIDLDALIEVAVWVESLLGRTLEGLVHRAGPFPPRAH